MFMFILDVPLILTHFSSRLPNVVTLPPLTLQNAPSAALAFLDPNTNMLRMLRGRTLRMFKNFVDCGTFHSALLETVLMSALC